VLSPRLQLLDMRAAAPVADVTGCSGAAQG
jgi:hypothetical protein